MILQKKIKEYTPEKILGVDPKIVTKLTKLLEHDMLQMDKVKGASAPCAALLGWINAVIQTNNALLVVEPKKAELAQANADLKNAKENLAVKQAALKVIMDKVAKLEEDAKKTKKQVDDLEEGVATCKRRIEIAGVLVDGLKGEKVAWAASLKKLRGDSKSITGDMFMCACTIAYMPPFPKLYRT